MSSNNSVSIGYRSLHYVCLKVNEVYFHIHIYVLSHCSHELGLGLVCAVLLPNFAK